MAKKKVKIKAHKRADGTKVKGHARVMTISDARKLAKKKKLTRGQLYDLDGFKSTAVLGKRADGNFKTSHQIKALRRLKKNRKKSKKSKK